MVFVFKMVSDICTRLLEEEWRLYELNEVPEDEGIYVIGIQSGLSGEPNVLYVGRTNNFRRRLREHTTQNLRIDEFLKERISMGKGGKLRVKWIEERNDDLTEKVYICCIAHKLNYWPRFNIRGSCLV